MNNRWSVEKGDYSSKVSEYLKMQKAAERRRMIGLALKMILGIILIGLITILIV